MTTVAQCFDLNEALRVKMLLEASGISAFIPDEHSAAIAPYHFMTPTGVRVQVAEENETEARRVLEENRTHGSPSS